MRLLVAFLDLYHVAVIVMLKESRIGFIVDDSYKVELFRKALLWIQAAILQASTRVKGFFARLNQFIRNNLRVFLNELLSEIKCRLRLQQTNLIN